MDETLMQLDNWARATLTSRQLREYNEYKQSLIRDGKSEQDFGEIIRGYIWSCIEEQDDDNDDH